MSAKRPKRRHSSLTSYHMQQYPEKENFTNIHLTEHVAAIGHLEVKAVVPVLLWGSWGEEEEEQLEVEEVEVVVPPGMCL